MIRRGKRRKGEEAGPSREDVKMNSSWNPSQEIGSEPTSLDCLIVSILSVSRKSHRMEHTIIGGSNAVMVRDSTG